MLASGYEAPLLNVQYFSETFPRGSRNEVKVLDVGAGTGMVARGLRAEGFRHIDAVDASEAMLSLARRDNMYDNYYCEFLADEELSCFEPDSYDGVWLFRSKPHSTRSSSLNHSHSQARWCSRNRCARSIAL